MKHYFRFLNTCYDNIFTLIECAIRTFNHNMNDIVILHNCSDRHKHFRSHTYLEENSVYLKY